MDLLQYEHLKFDLAAVLRAAGSRLPASSPRHETDVRDLFARLAEDRFNLVVVGRFSRGKSTLMNAILGMDRLPTGILPLTSVITTVTYGSDVKVVLHFPRNRLPLDIRLDQLSDYITEQGNPGNARGIRVAEVQLPAEILRQGFHFIDTPGLGSAIAENTSTTEAFFSEADAFILVTSYDGSLSEDELRALQAIDGSDRPCFVVLNKQDSVSASERAEVRAHVQAQLADLFGDDVPALYSVSARQGLAARLENNAAALAESGLLILEGALIEFLLTEKQRIFLLGMCARIEEFIQTTGADTALMLRLGEIRRQLANGGVGDGEAPVQDQHIGTAALPDCEICQRVCDALFNFLAKFQRQVCINPELQARHAASGGLCGRHMAQFGAIAATREKCTGFAPVLERQANRLRDAARKGGTPSILRDAVLDALPTEATCLACQVGRDAVSDAVHDIAVRLQDGQQIGLSSVVCVPHLAKLVPYLPADIGIRILNEQAVVLDRLADDMKRFALKQDGVKRHLASREEFAAGRRGFRALLGAADARVDSPIRGV